LLPFGIVASTLLKHTHSLETDRKSLFLCDSTFFKHCEDSEKGPTTLVTRKVSSFGTSTARSGRQQIHDNTMKFLEFQDAIGAVLFLLAVPCAAKHSHSLHHLEMVHKRHSHVHKHDHARIYASKRAEALEAKVVKRTTCAFPTGLGLVPVSSNSQNGGWALSPDQACVADSYCPYACPPGQVMHQWNPKATSYTYPLSIVCLVWKSKFLY
jgi:hypothetical protein